MTSFDIDIMAYRAAFEMVARLVSIVVIGTGLFQNVIYVVQLFVAGWNLFCRVPEADAGVLWARYNNIIPPISVIAPAYNEGPTVVASAESLLSLRYPNFQVIVVNDGSTDDTLDRLIASFELEVSEYAIDAVVPCQPIRKIWASRKQPNLVVIDKENGGKADALNAGINAAHKPLVCAIDADSLLEADSLMRATTPFIDDTSGVVAVGGTVRVVNGCVINRGKVSEIRLPNRLLPLFQTIEYLRSFLMARLAWSALGTLTLISGAFGVFRRDAVIAVGGYSTDTVGEDLELIIKLHRYMRERGQSYAVQFIPEPVCWTEVPSTWSSLARQRSRWQRGALETFFKHKDMLARWRYGRVGVLGIGQMLLIDVIGPVVEVIGYVLVPALWGMGLLSVDYLLAFLGLFFVFGIFISVGSLFLEEAELYPYPRARDLLILLFVAVLENFGYRQINNIFRIMGYWQFLRGTSSWGEMQRVGFTPAEQHGPETRARL